MSNVIKRICSSDNSIILSIVFFLEFPDLISPKISCKSLYAYLNHKIFRQYIRKGCLTNCYRKIFWMNNINYKKMARIIQTEVLEFSERDNLYQDIIMKAESDKSKIDLRFKRATEEINRDLDRTFHFGKFKTLDGQQEIGRVLVALAYVRPEI